MKQLADKRRSKRSFKDFLYYSEIGEVDYRLQLPQEAKIHNVFHVSLLNLAYAYVTASLE